LITNLVSWLAVPLEVYT